MVTHSSTLAWKIPWAVEPCGLQSMGSQRVGHDWATIFTFHFHALEKETVTHSSVLAWRIPGTAEPGGLPSMSSHRVGHDWSDLAAATYIHMGFPGGVSGKELTCQCRRHKRCRFSPWLGMIPWRRAWQHTPVFLPREPHRLWRVTLHRPTESDTVKPLSMFACIHIYMYVHTSLNHWYTWETNTTLWINYIPIKIFN